MAEMVAAKASETEAVVRRQQKQKECLPGGYVGGSQWNQRGSGDGGKKVAAVVAAAVAAATEGIWAKRFMNDIVETSHVIDARSANSTQSGIRPGGIG